MKFMKIGFLHVSAKILDYTSIFHLIPGHPLFSALCFLCVNGSETERTVWRHYGIVERIQALGSDLGKHPRRAKQ